MEPKTVRRDDGTGPARHIDSPDTLNALVAGTDVLTMDGAVPAEFLSTGDRVITRDSGVAVLRGVRRHGTRVRLLSVQPGSFGRGRPDSAVLIPASQQVLVRDWRAPALFGKDTALVPAERLADGEFVRIVGTRDVDLIELILDAPHIIYAGGLELAAQSLATVSA